ncbi:LysR family transcriptional regulator ArgP [Actinokineospora xionganensis]|uniref:LysR family transcriptional regulator ArgP n=1 Tax=Actinokineospora xionganensis TaxID=2684470 RepID=A0ABR7L082_9PSEU|nr:LysR family transcriptional regulator ArgP [Actinokineospora xionganensis]MBC6446084.1 LysR family transcriptional regulator ArgP [Actinokineospora xionganensis]
MPDLPLDLVRTLLAVVDEGTFDAAAAALHVTPSAVSQRVKALEQRTGRVLLMRTKPARATESGEVIVRFARQLLQLERDTLTELGLPTAGEAARLSIAVNADSLSTWFIPAMTRVPDIRFDLHREDEGHTTALLREGLVMAAVTSTPDPVQGCTVRALGNMRYLPCASPTFAARHLDGPPPTLIADAPVLVFDRRDQLQDHFVDTIAPGKQASQHRHHIPSSEGFVDAVAAGLGWGMVPEVQARPRITAGTLTDIGRPIDVPLYWQQWKLDSPPLAAAAQAIAAAAALALTPRTLG